MRHIALIFLLSVGIASAQQRTFLNTDTQSIVGSNSIADASITSNKLAFALPSGGSGAPLSGTNDWTGTNRFSNPLVWTNNGASIRAETSGLVGTNYNTANMGWRLQTNGSYFFGGSLFHFRGSGSPELRLDDTASKNPWITFNDNGTRRGYLQLSGNNSVVELFSEASDNIALRPATGQVGFGALTGARTPQAGIDVLMASSAQMMLERIGGSIPETNSFFFCLSSEPQGTIGGLHNYVMPQASLTFQVWPTAQANHAAAYPAAIAFTTSGSNNTWAGTPNFSIWPDGNVVIGRLLAATTNTYPTVSPFDSVFAITNNMAEPTGWTRKPTKLASFRSGEVGVVSEIGTNGVTLNKLLALTAQGSSITDTANNLIWNSNNFALYVRKTNGTDILLLTTP